ncbi:auxin-responsive protein IAA12-like isoform X2 [Primulina huaijiensis]|uniref:auxin-responsive protein IAA12-like isoform X2 n=1 Tax=Primulina huaijiensis TaxID=1492673 RepID=UPI003CC6FB90
MSSEASSSYMDDSELDLGLGLSLAGSRGRGGKLKTKSLAPPPAQAARGQWYHQYARILTARDFSSVASSSSSSSVTKRTAEPPSPPGRSGVSHVVGWPPIRTHRMNSLVYHTKSPETEELNPAVDKCKSRKNVVDNTDFGSSRSCSFVKQKRPLKASFLVKVNMDGFPIGRKVDMNSHDCYKTLALTIDNMFSFNAGVGARRSKVEEQARGPARLLGGLSDFMLTYEDKEGDWMLVGDVPWEMFLSTVKRLRITRTANAHGLAPKSHENNRTHLSTRL